MKKPVKSLKLCSRAFCKTISVITIKNIKKNPNQKQELRWQSFFLLVITVVLKENTWHFLSEDFSTKNAINI